MLQLWSLSVALNVLLIRHGETVWNVQGRVQGSDDSALTEEGVRQAVATGRRLAGMRIDAVYSSPIPRAKRTAELILQEAKCDLPICDEPRLAERCFGVFEGLRWPEVEDRYPAELAAYKADPAYAMPGAESREQVLDRAFGWLMELAESERREAGEAPSSRVVVVVTHSGLISCVLKRVLGLGQEQPRTFDVPNLGLIELEWQRGAWFVRTLGDRSHLSEPQSA